MSNVSNVSICDYVTDKRKSKNTITNCEFVGLLLFILLAMMVIVYTKQECFDNGHYRSYLN